jgi:7-cyano-7-deazaguanine synthase in queuosine biosynthesis
MTKKKRKPVDAMPTVRVAVVEKGVRAPRSHAACIIGENLDFSTSRLESYCLASFNPVVFDALLVAASVEFCDRVQKRPTLSWGRRFELQIPVHDVDRWSSKSVIGALIEALDFLTGDTWSIQFTKRRKPVELPQQGNLAIPLDISAIIPFSDGMDSRAVSTLYEKQEGNRVCRVRLGPSGIHRKASDKQGLPFTSVPYEVSTGKRSGETSARSRGFKFATVSAVAAHLVGARQVIVPESGQGALGSALVPTGHGYEDYRNHPLYTDRVERYFKALLGSEIRFRFPRLWKTKGETLAEFAKIADKNAHVGARSCWQQNRHTSIDKHWRQCGICAACMLRRLSVHAAGLKEPVETYLWEDLGAPTFEKGVAKGFKKITRALREYAIAGTLHLDHLAELRDAPHHKVSLRRIAHQLARSQGLSLEEAEANLDRLLTQHQTEWRGFVKSLGQKSFVANWTSSTS